ncbi:MAG TPA: glycosyltransferase family 9 protein, partial [Puia sp.]|nr:glycosyltransferase family 9 protein [Puia sp.]
MAIRLQAMGDLVITLPYLQNLRNSLPQDAKLDLLTREEVEAIPRNIFLFDKVYSIGGGRDLKKQLFFTFMLLPRLTLRRYDVVIDLQNNIISKIIRKGIRPKAWSEFERFSPVAAGECTRLAIEAIGINNPTANYGLRLRGSFSENEILNDNGWNIENELVVLNPAGAFPSRHWPMENYVQFANLWKEHYPKTQFLVLGTSFIASKAAYLKNMLGENLIDLTNKTTTIQAFAILQKAKLVISEDSGLMHMSWISGIPTIAMFGSTWSARARPLGYHT